MSNKKAVIIKDTAPLKQKPEYNSELTDEVLFGWTVDILEITAEWLYVQTSYNYKGYLKAEEVLFDSNNLWESIDKQFVIASFADILSDPKYSAGIITTIPRGSCIAVTGEVFDKWLEVKLPMGKIGWIREEAICKSFIDKGSELRQSIVDIALLYLGTQYRFSGKSPMGIDCSGLSSMAYLMNGLIIPRDSEDQLKAMKKIQRKQSKPGDLLFFPGHVAIYIGEDKFVHASGMDAVVKVNSLNKDSKLYRKDLDEKYICTGTVF
jgi:beta-lactamase class A